MTTQYINLIEANPIEARIHKLLNKSYGYDVKTQELQYLGNPLTYWQTKYEAKMFKLALANVESKH